MALKIAFQMEHLAEVNPAKNNSLTLMEKAAERGHSIFQYHPSELSYNNGKVVAYGRDITLFPTRERFFEQGKAEYRDLAEFNVVMIRQDPPFDIRYVTNTYILDMLPETTLCVNRASAVRNFAEKLFPLQFTKHIPRTVVTDHTPTIRHFWKEEGTVILKPLYLFGGSEIHLCGPDTHDIELLAQKLINHTEAPIVAQQYVPEAKLGDKRILLVDGEIVGAFLRVPAEGKVAANLMQGGSLHEAEITANDRLICEDLKPVLKENGILICGIDVLGNYLTEINITSPIGFRELEKLYKSDTAALFWEKVEARFPNSSRNTPAQQQG